MKAYVFKPKHADLADKSPAQLKTMIQALRSDCESAEERIQRLNSYIQQLQKDRDDATRAKEEYKDLETKIAPLRAENVILSKQLVDAENARKSLIEELSGTFGQTEVEFMEATTWTVLVSKITEIIHEIEKSQEEIQAALQEDEKLQNEKRDLSRSLAEKENELRIVRHELNIAEQRLLILQQEEKDIEVTENKAIEIECHKNSLRDSENEKATSSQLSHAEKTTEVLQQRIIELEKINQELQEEMIAILCSSVANDELQSVIDYFDSKFERIRQKDDRQSYVEEFYEYAEHNLWHSNFALSSLK